MQGSNPNIYDSWRSQHNQHQPSQSRFAEEEDFYNYDSHDPYNDLNPKLYPQQYPYAGSNSNRYLNQQYMMEQNNYPYASSNYSRKYSREGFRDYDPNFWKEN